jgi:outer membrane receptor protein involved in Fe transport
MLGTLVRRAVCGTAGALLLAGFAVAGELRPPFRGMSLEQAIAVLESRGMVIVYSSALVKPWMRIRAEPTNTEPERVLEELLAPFSLMARRAPNSVLAIVRRPGPVPAPVPRDGATRAAAPLLTPRATSLEQVVVAASRYELTRNISASLKTLSAMDIESLPDVGDDTLRAVAWLPGAASDGISARTSVRGGAPDENLLRLDGLRLYQSFHLKDFQSLFSAIDPRIVSSVEVYTSGFDARFGDRMSGVVDITSMSPPAPLYHEIGVSFFNTAALGAGRFADDRGEWLLSARRGNLDVWYHALSNEPGTPSYRDAFAKVSYRVNDRLRLTANALVFGDEVGLAMDESAERANAEYTNRNVWLRIEQQPTASLSGTTLLAQTHLRSGRSGDIEKEGLASGHLSDQRTFDIGLLQTDWSWRASGGWLFQFGGELRRARGVYDYDEQVEFDLLFDTPGAFEGIEREFAVHVRPRQTQYALYAGARHGLTTRVTTDVGVRWDNHDASPRVGLRYQLGERTALRASWSRMLQTEGIDELPASDGVTEFFSPQRTDHTAVAVEHRFVNDVELRAELYDKRQRHLRPRFENLLNPFTLVPELTPDRLVVTPEHGRASGVELSIARRRSGASHLSWWVAFSRSVAGERDGEVDTYRAWHQRNSLSAGLDWTSERWSMSLALMERSGWPTTEVGLERAGPVPVVATGTRNANRAALYRTLNARIARNLALDHSSLSVYFELVNALGRANPCCSTYEIDDETGRLEVERRAAVPRLPTLGVLWQF